MTMELNLKGFEDIRNKVTDKDPEHVGSVSKIDQSKKPIVEQWLLTIYRYPNGESYPGKLIPFNRKYKPTVKKKSKKQMPITIIENEVEEI